MLNERNNANQKADDMSTTDDTAIEDEVVDAVDDETTDDTDTKATAQAEPTESIALARKQNRSARAKRFFGPEGPLEEVTLTWRIIFGLLLVAICIWVWTQNSGKGPSVVIQNGGQGEAVAEQAAPIAMPNPLDSLPWPLHPSAEQLIDIEACDPANNCTLDSQRSQLVYAAILRNPGGDICKAQFAFDVDANVEISYGPTFPSHMIPLVDCTVPEEDDGVTLFEGEELPGAPLSEIAELEGE